MSKRILIIHNPAAGRGAAPHLAAVKTALESRGCDVTLMATASVSQVSALCSECVADDWDVVAIAGGDGTLMQTINGLAGQPPVLALIATGTANVVALDLGLVVDAETLADGILAGKTRQLSAGRINNRLFTLTAGVGFDAQVVARVRPLVKKSTGKMAFVLAAISTLLVYRFSEYKITADSGEYSGAGIIVVNGRHYAGKYLVAPGNDLGNGSLCALILNKPGRLAALAYLLAMARDRLHTRADVTYLQDIRSIDIEGDAMTPVQVDGEIACHLPARITSDAKRFEILA